jgi:hypothetical protein
MDPNTHTVFCVVLLLLGTFEIKSRRASGTDKIRLVARKGTRKILIVVNDGLEVSTNRWKIMSKYQSVTTYNGSHSETAMYCKNWVEQLKEKIGDEAVEGNYFYATFQ